MPLKTIFNWKSTKPFSYCQNGYGLAFLIPNNLYPKLKRYQNSEAKMIEANNAILWESAAPIHNQEVIEANPYATIINVEGCNAVSNAD